jgi:hypothetical protein
MEYKYKKYNNKKMIKQLALDIVNVFELGTAENFDYSYDVSKVDGVMQKEYDEDGQVKANTIFFGDCKEGTTLDEFKKSLFDEELSDISEDDELVLQKETDEITQKVSSIIISKYIDRIRGHIRKVILPSSEDRIETFPLEKIDIFGIEIVDYSSIPEYGKRVIKIFKKPKTVVATEQALEYIFDMSDKTGLPLDQIFNAEKDINPLFQNITDIEFGKRYLFEINVSLLVDYSYVDKK